MKVMKFGGTSVGKPERMHHIVSLVTKESEPAIVVLSALSGGCISKPKPYFMDVPYVGSEIPNSLKFSQF